MSQCHQQGRMRARQRLSATHDRGALSPTTKQGAHYRHMHATGMCHDRGANAKKVFCHDRDFSVATNLYRSKKKKDLSKSEAS